MSQMEMVDLDSLVSSTHLYRRFQAYLPDSTEALAAVRHLKGADGYGVERLFRCLLVQFMEDLSDRELERYLEENLAAKWLCGFTLSEPTPDYSLFSRVRTRIGPTRLSPLFATMREQLKAAGLMSEVFTFVDATHLLAKATLWEERDKARQQHIEKLNNTVLPKVAVDKQARIGCKGKKKYWYGYKEHVSVEMQSGLINKWPPPQPICPMPTAFDMSAPPKGRSMETKAIVRLQLGRLPPHGTVISRPFNGTICDPKIGIAIGGIRSCARPMNGSLPSGRSGCGTAAWPRINSRPSYRRWCLTSNGWLSSTRNGWRPN